MSIQHTITETSGERRLTTRFLIEGDEFAKDDNGETFRPALEVTTSHNKDRKALVTSINRIWVGTRMIRMVIDYNQGDEPPVNTYVGQGIDRYSARALGERHGQIKSNIASAGVFNELLEWATRAKFL